MSARSRATLILSALLVALGLVVIVETVVLGGGIGLVLGVLLVLAGALRSYVTLSSRPRGWGPRGGERRGETPR